MPAAPPESCHQGEPQQESENRVDVDPKALRLLGPGIVQQAQYADNDHQHEHEPVKRDGAGPIAAESF